MQLLHAAIAIDGFFALLSSLFLPQKAQESNQESPTGMCLASCNLDELHKTQSQITCVRLSPAGVSACWLDWFGRYLAPHSSSQASCCSGSRHTDAKRTKVRLCCILSLLLHEPGRRLRFIPQSWLCFLSSKWSSSLTTRRLQNPGMLSAVQLAVKHVHPYIQLPASSVLKSIPADGWHFVGNHHRNTTMRGSM